MPAGAAALALGLILSLNSPAQAANIVLTTNIDQTSYGEAGGRITFPNRNTFKIVDGWVQDFCDGGADGRGIYLYATAYVRNATSWKQVKLGLVGKDANGCGQNPVYFDTFKRSFKRELRYVELRLCEENRDVSTRCLTKAQKNYDNPRF